MSLFLRDAHVLMEAFAAISALALVVCAACLVAVMSTPNVADEPQPPKN